MECHYVWGVRASHAVPHHTAWHQMPRTHARSHAQPRAGYKGASDLFVDANIQLALAGARTVGGWWVDGVMLQQARRERGWQAWPARPLHASIVAAPLHAGTNIASSIPLHRLPQLAASGRKVHVVMPDQGEYNRAYKMWVADVRTGGGGWGGKGGEGGGYLCGRVRAAAALPARVPQERQDKRVRG